MQSTQQDGSKIAFYGYVSTSIHDRFEKYRSAIGLTSASALASLLIVREVSLKRLTADSVQANVEPRNAKVSAYVPNAHALLFKEHATGLGRSHSDCLAELVEREVDELWLQKALRHHPDGSAP